jgi:hypothetical protein
MKIIDLQQKSLLELLEEFERLNLKLKGIYRTDYNNRDKIFRSYGLIRKYKKLDLALHAADIYGGFIPFEEKGENEKERTKLKNEIEKTGFSIEEYLHLINLIKVIILIKHQIKKKLYEYSDILPVGSDIKNKLKMIRDDMGFFIDEIYQEFLIKAELDNFADLLDDDNEFEIFDFYHYKYDATDFYRRAVQVGAFVVSKEFPNSINSHIFNIKECYALGLLAASIIYCRALIEAGTQHYLQNKNNKIAYIGQEFKLTQLLRDIKECKRNENKLNKQMIDGAYDVKNIADNQLHSEELIEIDESKTFEAIKKTFLYIEYIFQ